MTVCGIKMEDIATAMKRDANEGTPFSKEELDSAVSSLKRCLTSSEEAKDIDWGGLAKYIRERAHLPAKAWDTTKESAAIFEGIVGNPNDSKTFRKMFERILNGGNWYKAKEFASKRGKDFKPWVVLVMGVNGIRKTTSTYQKWFAAAVKTALGNDDIDIDDLPCGSNSFFRQLDYMIATLANKEFQNMYEGKMCNKGAETHAYSKYKDAIFARYRAMAEALGILLLNAAKKARMNVMVETSGRDIASFAYIERFFPDDSKYRKLVVNFSIDKLVWAQNSVGGRMKQEMREGRAAILRQASIHELVAVNAGGPYGTEVLERVQSESTKVWDVVSAAITAAEDHHAIPVRKKRRLEDKGLVKAESIEDENAITSERSNNSTSVLQCSWRMAHIAVRGNVMPEKWTARAVVGGAEVGDTFSYTANVK